MKREMNKDQGFFFSFLKETKQNYFLSLCSVQSPSVQLCDRCSTPPINFWLAPPCLSAGRPLHFSFIVIMVGAERVLNLVYDVHLTADAKSSSAGRRQMAQSTTQSNSPRCKDTVFKDYFQALYNFSTNTIWIMFLFFYATQQKFKLQFLQFHLFY